MKKTFQKTLIAAATGVALMSAVGSASANSLLFPYFTTNTGAQSVLTLTTSSSVSGASTGEAIHYVYNYGTGCVHYDAWGTLTANDTLSHSIADPAAGGFGKVVGTDKSTPVYFPLAGQTGFLIVSNKTTNPIDAISGSVAIVDPSSGLVVSYPGVSNALDTSVAANEGNFASITDVRFPLSFLPVATVSTSWYGVVAGNQNAAVTGNRSWTAAVSISNQGLVYDNDEVQYSGTAAKTISCGGSFTATDLETTAQAAKVGVNGGVIKSLATPIASTASNGINAADVATGLVLSKLQTVLPAVGAPFAGKTFLHRETVLSVSTALGGTGVGF